MVGERDKYLAAGMNAYMSKPFETDQLFATIKRCIGDDNATTGCSLTS